MGEETKQEEAKPAETKVEEKKEEEKKDEEKKEEKKEEDKKEEEKKEEEKKEEEATPPPPPPPPPPPVILSVDLHCLGCAKKIERCLLKCKGVEEVEIDMGQDQLKIKGVVDPQALCSRIQKKTLRSAKVISPVLPPPEEADSAKPQVVASQVSGVTTVELHVNMHCEACAQQLRRKILKMRGVQAAETDLSSGKVMVTGTMTGDKIADYIYRRTGKLAKVILPPPPPPPPPEEEKKDEGEKKPGDPKPEEEKKEEKPAEEKKEENAEKKEDEKSPPDGKKEEGGEEAKKEGDQLAQANMQYTGPDPDMFKRMYWNNGVGGYFNDSYMGEDYNYYGKRMPVPWVAPGVPAVYMIERPPPPPQLFSDENPNACCIS